MKEELQEAENAYRSGIVALERIVDHSPDHLGWQRDLALGRNKIGQARLHQGDSISAFEEFEVARAIQERLIERSPESTLYKEDLALTYESLAFVTASHGLNDAARTALRESRSHWEDLTRTASENTGWRQKLEEVTRNLDVLESTQADPARTASGGHRRSIPLGVLLLAFGVFDLSFAATIVYEMASGAATEATPLARAFGLAFLSGIGLVCTRLGIRHLRGRQPR